MEDRNPYAQLNEADSNNNIIHSHNPYQTHQNQNINPHSNYNQNQPQNQYNPNQRQSYRQSVHSLPEAVGYVPNPHPIIGVPAYQNQGYNQGYNQNQNQNQGYNPYNNYVPPNQVPQQYRGDGYYNPDVVQVVVAPPARNRNRAKILGCLSFVILAVILLPILITNIS